MSVLIKGMEMPEACCACPCNYDNVCAVTNQFPTFEEWYESKPSWCPLVPVPDHNDRLIDAGEFEVVSYKGIPDGYKDTFDDGVLWMGNKIDNAPTIIPAADVVPVRHGHWFESSIRFPDELTSLFGYKCSECGEFCTGESHYCPHCGARTDGAE